MSAPTPEQRAEWRREAETYRRPDRHRILVLLDALNDAEREREDLARWKADATPILDGLDRMRVVVSEWTPEHPEALALLEALDAALDGGEGR